ncbi:hypothetical protein D3Y59_09050 [Hymenobacter oligotrophus]|uniref:Glycosyltransferase RgtA/B/C/D-like domain-containing protein n=1 Tax=Hymenobacter oligotrophus TaxID=2319843 RepID=A0A3B7QZ87_9BACT|nr:hypothetical protein [Hymenobacter oligotrophus]AYA37184.1 hypothetical protein D3Y59_09050 [Hymenobacter oligotrophus]
MELKDLFLTPLYLGILYGIAFALRKRYTNALTRRYFIPALTVKFIGAIGLGLIYQFYYGGGDTFNYFSHVKVVHEAFGNSFGTGLKLLMAQTPPDGDMLRYTMRMYWYEAPTEYFIVQIASVFSLLCFNSYAVIALCFAFVSFCGMWAMYVTFLRIYPLAYKKLAIAVFFLPSVFFWGSGLMKDSLCIGALGWTFYGFYHFFIAKKNLTTAALLGALGAYILISVKVYILLSFLPAALIWVFTENNRRIKSAALRTLLKPLFLGLGVAAGYFGATNLTAGDEKYDVDKLGERAKITRDYLTTYVASGSVYNIGEFDGSLGSTLKVAPQAIVVSIFRPFLFEVRNPVMLLSALEATMFIWLTLSLFYRAGFLKGLSTIIGTPILSFSFLFALVFAIGVGINSGNFGTLVRYKIPLMPFYLSALYIMQHMQIAKAGSRRGTTRAAQLNKARKLGRLAITE